MIIIIAKLRDLIQDGLITNGTQTEEYLVSKIFTLYFSNVESSTIKVYRNGALVSGANYTFDEDTAKLTYTGTILAGDNIEITYSYYSKYSYNELAGYVRSAIYHLGMEQYKTFIIESGDILDPEPTENEENLIAIVASILVKGNIRSYKTPEFTIVFGDNMSSDQIIKQCVRQFKKAYGVYTYIDLEKEPEQLDE